MNTLAALLRQSVSVYLCVRVCVSVCVSPSTQLVEVPGSIGIFIWLGPASTVFDSFSLSVSLLFRFSFSLKMLGFICVFVL